MTKPRQQQKTPITPTRAPKSIVSFEECVARMHYVFRRDTEISRAEIAFQKKMGWRKANDNYDPSEWEHEFRITQPGESLRDFKVVQLRGREALEKAWWRKDHLGDFYIMSGGRLQMCGFRWTQFERVARMFGALHPDERLEAGYRGGRAIRPRSDAYDHWSPAMQRNYRAFARGCDIRKHEQLIAGFSWRAPGGKRLAA